MIKTEIGSYSMTCTNRVAGRLMQVRPALKRIIVKKNVSAHSGFGGTGLGVQYQAKGGHRAMTLESWGISQISSVHRVGDLWPVNTSLNCVLSAGNCAKYHHSVQVACNIRHTPYCLMLVHIINLQKHTFERGFLFSVSSSAQPYTQLKSKACHTALCTNTQGYPLTLGLDVCSFRFLRCYFLTAFISLLSLPIKPCAIYAVSLLIET